MKCTIVTLLLIAIPTLAMAQELNHQWYFNISYFGILGTHPGIKFGIHQPLATFNPDRTDRKLRQLVGSSSLIVYFHRRNQLGIGVNLELGYRDKQVWKTTKEITAGIGYLRTFVPGRKYDFDREKPFTGRSAAGTGHFIKTLSLGLGKRSGENIEVDTWMIKPTLLHIKPYNTGTTLNFALDVGYQFK